MSKRFSKRKRPSVIYSSLSARDNLLRWMISNGKNKVNLQRYLAGEGLLVSNRFITKIVNGEEEPSKAFVGLFHEVTGVRLEAREKESDGQG